MTIRKNIFLRSVLSLFILMILFTLGVTLLLLRGFRQMESNDVTRTMRHLTISLDDEVADLLGKTTDYAYWDDTYAYVQNHDPTYWLINFSDSAMINQHLALIAILDASGQVLFARYIEPGKQESHPLPAELASHLQPGSLFMQRAQTEYADTPFGGLLHWADRQMVIALAPIHENAGGGAAQGFLIMGQNVSQTELSQMLDSSSIQARLFDSDTTQLPQAIIDWLGERRSQRDEVLSVPENAETIKGYTVLPTADGVPHILEIALPRDIYHKGFTLLWLMLAGLGILCTGSGVFYIRYLNLAVFRRFEKIIDSIKTISAQPQFTARVPVDGEDELTVLSQSINYLLDALSASETRREEDEVQLRLLSSAVEQSANSVIITDQAGRIEYVNPKFEAVTGYTAAEMAGQKPNIFKSGHTSPEEYQRLWDTVRAGEVWRGEFLNLRKSGQRFWELTSITPIKAPSGQITHLLAIKEDITERKRWEEALNHANLELMHALEKAQELAASAEEANRAKSEFLANMSHEIRTPLNAVIGMSSLMLDTTLTTEQRDFAETIRSSADSLLGIVNDILDFTKIESGRLDLEQEPFDLFECVESALDQVAQRAAEKGLEIAYFIAETVPRYLIGDITRVRQMLLNYLSNAVKFTEQGEVYVSLLAELQSDSRYCVHVSVRDTGMGIQADRMDRLFQSFSQVDSSTTRRFGGTGLGLAICRRLSELMGGSTWVESELGRGSTFHFTFLAAASKQQPAARSWPPQADLQGKRVLIVDDNATNRFILTRQTQKWGMSSRSVASGRTALDVLASGAHFDIAILDMQMPEMDGMKLAEAIKAYPEWRDLPLVLLTSLGGREMRNGNTLFAAYLTKPVKPAQLCAMLAGLLAQTAKPATSEHPLTRSIPTSENPTLRILLAEDNLINQKVALRLLERMGYRVDVANNGLEVLAAMRLQPYDVILMDVHMPEMDGLEATQRVRQEFPAEHQPRIVAMTAGVSQEDRQRTSEAGMDDYISKPVRPEALQRALEASTSRIQIGI